ncbi:MAG TPA: hypothetical protein VLQ78_11100 [Ornithinibacter sp.]|nr:hypothetical protein [Ornithinibacter sp.]
MSTIRVDAAEVAELGVALAETGADLLLMGDPAAERWALGPGATGPAVEELLGGWRRSRLALAGALVELGDGAVEAGSAYVDTETGVSRSLLGGGW